MSQEEKIETVRDDAALISLCRVLIKAVGETKDERIADIASYATGKLKEIPGVVERLLLETEPQEIQEPYNPFPNPVPRRTR